MKRLVLAVFLMACAAPASGAPITWAFDSTLSVQCAHAGSNSCAPDMLPYVALDGAVVHGEITFDSAAVDASPSPVVGVYTLSQWTLDVPVLNTTWIADSGNIEVGTVQAPSLGASPCFGCLAAFGYFSRASNPNAPGPPGPGPQVLPFQFLALQPFVTDALPASLTSFQTLGGFFVGATQITAQPFTVRAVPEPASLLLMTSGAALSIARRRLRSRAPASGSRP